MSSNLLDALTFIAPAQDEVGPAYKCHCKIENGFAKATNGIFTIGHPVNFEGVLYPHTIKMKTALEKCGDDYKIKKLVNNRISVKSGNVKLIVPGIENSMDIPNINPEGQDLVINDNMKDAFKAVCSLANETAQETLKACIFVKSGSCLSTNKSVVLEYWHGIDLPKFQMPKKAANLIAACEKPLKTLKVTDHSASFIFEDNSFIMTQLFNENLPDIEKPLNSNDKAEPIHEKFFQGLETVLPFSDNGDVYLYEKGFRSHSTNNDDGCEFSFDCEIPLTRFNGNDLKLIKRHAKTMFVGRTLTHFYGDMLRGVVANKRLV